MFKHIQIKRHLKCHQSKESKSHVNIDISFENNEHSCDNIIENISIEHINNISKNILSSNIIQ